MDEQLLYVLMLVLLLFDYNIVMDMMVCSCVDKWMGNLGW